MPPPPRAVETVLAVLQFVLAATLPVQTRDEAG
jgi:hypothetical protein